VKHAGISSESNAHDWVNQKFPDHDITAPKNKFSRAFTPWHFAGLIAGEENKWHRT